MRWHRAFDVALGLSAISWAVLGVVEVEHRPPAVRLGLAALNLVVGGLFLARSQPVASGDWRAIAAALPSMVAAGLAVRLAEGSWPVAGQALFVLGAVGACASLATLGRSFALLPSRRGLVVRGPYGWVRHPAYACELVMLVGCAVAQPLTVGPLVVVAALTLAWRIHAEERVLAHDEDWARYRAKVGWRLVPGVY